MKRLDYGLKDLGFKSCNKPEIFIFSKTSGLVLSPSRLLLSNESGDFFPMVMRLACETDHLSPFKLLAYVFKACLGKTVPSHFCTRSFINQNIEKQKCIFSQRHAVYSWPKQNYSDLTKLPKTQKDKYINPI